MNTKRFGHLFSSDLHIFNIGFITRERKKAASCLCRFRRPVLRFLLTVGVIFIFSEHPHAKVLDQTEYSRLSFQHDDYVHMRQRNAFIR